MKNTHDIIDEYLQMRQSNAAREQADMLLLQYFNDQLREKERIISEQEQIIRQQQRTIEEMKAARPLNIENLNGPYIETVQKAELCQPSSTISTEPTSSTSIPSFSSHITPLQNE